MSIVGIDPSLTSCGIAVLEQKTLTHDVYNGFGRVAPDRTFSGGRVTCIVDLRSVGHAGRDGASYADRSDRIVSQARHVVSFIPRDAELVVIEDMPQGIKSMPSLGDRWAVWWGIYSSLHARRIPIAVCNPGTRAKWATGNGRSDKRDVLAAVRACWPGDRIANHDVADALTMASMGALHLGWTLPFEIKPRHHAGLEAVAWPKETSNA